MGAAAGVIKGDMVYVECHSPAGIVCYPKHLDFPESAAELDWGDDMSDDSLNGDGAFYDLY